MFKGTAGRKMKSISVEDLGTIVKQMINGALEDTEQMAKLHRAIYEELYLEKLTELEGGSVEEKLTENSSRKIFKRESIRNIIDCDELEKCAKKESKTNCILEKSEDFPFNGQGDNEKVQKTVNESSKISMINKSLEENEIRTQNSAETETTVTNTIKQSKRSLDENTQRTEQAFDIWRKKKRKTMRLMMSEERRKRQEELTAKEDEIERRKVTHEEYLRLKKVPGTERKLEETQRRAMREDYSRIQEEEENARIVANEEAFKAWIKRKNSESSQRCFQGRRCRLQTGRTRYCKNVEFDSWLDQLDLVLHQKYLRERRYRVRSFYCQPAYYGTAALYAMNTLAL